MRRWLILVALFLLPAAVSAALTAAKQPGLVKPEARSPWRDGYVPNVSVVTQDGKTVKFYDDLIKGKIAVINFIFTGCSQLCPLTTARLAEVQAQLGESAGRDIFFYSISLDPLNDTPAALKKFANGFKIGPGWQFLTGDPEDMKLIRDRLGERSRDMSEHQALVVLTNDKTGEWRKDSAMSETAHLVETIRGLSPEWQNTPQVIADNPAGSGTLAFKNVQGFALFAKGCASCHTIGKGDKIGPDLAGVSTRRDRDWLKKIISRPDQMRESGDKTAAELFEKYNRVMMPYLGLSETDAEDALSYIDGETETVKTAETAAHAQNQ
jgi:protein SCO1